MKRSLPWIGLGLLALAVSGSTFSCGGDDKKGGGGTAAKDGGKGGSGGIIGGSGGVGATGGGTGATGGSGGDAGTKKKLGAACATDTECGQGLVCEKQSSSNWDGEGPAKGYCTIDCTADTDCAPF